MRVVLAVVGWVVISFLWLVFGAYLLDGNVPINLARFILLAGELALIVFAIRFAMNGTSNGAVVTTADNHSNAVSVTAINDQIRQRFSGRIYIYPDEEKNFAAVARGKSDLANLDKWRWILETFPAEPRTQREALESEQEFWRVYADLYTQSDRNGRPDLTKQADIIESYTENEAWILRAYFAATGKVIDPFIKEEERIFTALRKEERKFIWGDDQKLAQNRSDTERLTRELEQHRIHGKKSHFEKWAKWFALHVEEQFKRDNKPAQPLPDEVHGSGGYASAEDINGLRAKARVPTMPAAHQQSFKD